MSLVAALTRVIAVLQTVLSPAAGRGPCVTLDGFEVLRVRDCSLVDADFKRKEFYERALLVKALSSQPFHGKIGDMGEAIATCSKAYPLLVVSRERVERSGVSIGRVTGLSQAGFRLTLIDPSARFDDSDTFYRYNSIIRLECGGEYETTLALVAGLGPTETGSVGSTAP